MKVFHGTLNVINVEIQFFSKTKKRIDISGTRVNDTNLGKQFDSGLIGPKQTFTQTFKSTGEFSYFCQIHPTMVGKISVK